MIDMSFVSIVKPAANSLVKITYLKIKAGYICLNDLHVRINVVEIQLISC
jgi:hypothetical protein